MIWTNDCEGKWVADCEIVKCQMERPRPSLARSSLMIYYQEICSVGSDPGENKGGKLNMIRHLEIIKRDDGLYDLFGAEEKDLSIIKNAVDSYFESLWRELEDIPFDEDENTNLVLAIEWQGYPIGTNREEIWHWFDDNHSKGVAYLIYELDTILK